VNIKDLAGIFDDPGRLQRIALAASDPTLVAFLQEQSAALDRSRSYAQIGATRAAFDARIRAIDALLAAVAHNAAPAGIGGADGR
jgi:hypothetical protein